MSISVFCSGCNKTYRVSDELAGRRGKCPQGHVLLIPLAEAVAAVPAQPGPAPSVKLAADSPRHGPAAAAAKKCPSCTAALPESAILCVECGFDLRTGKKVSATRMPGILTRKLLLFIGLGAGAVIAVAVALSVFIFGARLNAEQPAVKMLLVQVRDVSNSDAERYEKAMASGQFLEILIAEGSLPSISAETDEVKRLGLEGSAISALLNVIHENRNSTSMKDLLICGRALEALGRLGPAAKETIPLLEDLTKHKAGVVSAKASRALETIQDEI